MIRKILQALFFGVKDDDLEDISYIVMPEKGTVPLFYEAFRGDTKDMLKRFSRSKGVVEQVIILRSGGLVVVANRKKYFFKPIKNN